MNVFNILVKTFLQVRQQRIDRFRNDPHRYQDKWFNYLTSQAAATQWGAHLKLNKDISYKAFTEQIPVQSYEQLYPYIERMLRGEEGVLWPEKVKWFSKSSGTTNNRSKYIPVPDESLSKNHFLAGQDMLTSYITNVPSTRLYAGNTISVGGTLKENPFGGKAMCGDVSAVIMQNLPFWAQKMRSPSLEVALMEKWEEKMAAIIAETLPQKITSLSGVPTWIVLLLKEAMAVTGKKTVAEIWPDLELFVHGAVSFAPYRQLFDDLIGRPDMHYLEVYNASEGYFAFQDDLSLEAQMLLLTDHGVFYEFVPVSEGR